MTGRSYKIRKFKEADVPEIVNLLNLVFTPPKPFSEEWWHWKYEYNPSGFDATNGSIWVAEDNGKIIGHYAVIPCKMKFGRESIIAGQSVDTAVNPEYRRIGIFEALAKETYAAIKESYVFLFGFPSDMAYQGFLKLGWTKHSLTELWKFNNFDRPLGSMFSNRLYCTFGKLYLKSWTATKKLSSAGNRPKSGNNFKFEHIDKFPEELDSFWQENRNNEDTIVERSAQYLNWRFAKALGDYDIWLARSTQNDSILGYFVTSVASSKIKNVLNMVDIYAKPTEHRLVQGIIDQCSKENKTDIVRVRLPQKNEYGKAFSSNGFLEVSKFFEPLGVYQSPLIVYDFNGQHESPKIENWAYSFSDTDYA